MPKAVNMILEFPPSQTCNTSIGPSQEWALQKIWSNPSDGLHLCHLLEKSSGFTPTSFWPCGARQEKMPIACQLVGINSEHSGWVWASWMSVSVSHSKCSGFFKSLGFLENRWRVVWRYPSNNTWQKFPEALTYLEAYFYKLKSKGVSLYILIYPFKSFLDLQ